MAEQAPPQLLTTEQKDEIIKKLQTKGMPKGCPWCGTNTWTIADGYFNNTLQGSLQGFVFGGAFIPSIAVVCNNCGFMSQHAIGALGLLPKTDAEAK